MPVRIEQSMRYGFQGREYRLERRPDGQSSWAYEASDFRLFGDVWVPYVGRQCTYRPKKQNPNGSDFDALAEKLLAEGTMRFPGELQLGYSYEWRILDIEQIDPSLNLWFEPQPGAEVVNMETRKRYVQGDAVASQTFAAREQAIEARVGHSAPEFPEGATWLNGQPLTWKALRGKVVILDFWADWCGPCRNDLPRLRQLHEDRGNNGLIIIGVHLAGSKRASVEKAISDLHLEYPICIDIPNRRETGKIEEMLFPSKFSSQFAIGAIPHFVVVDRHGIVAASLANRFQDALAIAHGLAKAKY
jgi:thiol-disulfide isomerase/thioredoxin